jgi:hypothetical protein
LDVVFLAGAFFATGFLAVVFLAAGLTLLALALAAARFFSRAALFLWIKPFLAALSILLWASACVLLDGFDAKDFRDDLSARLVLLLRTAALWATRTLFLADLIMGICYLFQLD